MNNITEWVEKEWTVEDTTPENKEIPEIPAISHKGIHIDGAKKVDYSLARKALDPAGDIIIFSDTETAIMNTLDELKSRGITYISLDTFIREYYHAPTFRPSPEQREEMANRLSELAMLTGMSIAEKGGDLNVSVGALVPIKIDIKLRANGKETDGIKILDHTCIYGVDMQRIEYWRLQLPNMRMKKTDRNIIISRRVLDSYLKGNDVDISELCEATGATKDGRRDVIQMALQCINYQRGKAQPEPEYKYEETDKSGRPPIKAIGTK